MEVIRRLPRPQPAAPTADSSAHTHTPRAGASHPSGPRLPQDRPAEPPHAQGTTATMSTSTAGTRGKETEREMPGHDEITGPDEMGHDPAVWPPDAPVPAAPGARRTRSVAPSSRAAPPGANTPSPHVTDGSSGINLQAATREEITSYTAFVYRTYTHDDVQDRDLWEAFREDFRDFNSSHFEELSPALRHSLFGLLRRRGVWVQASRKPRRECLEDLLHERHPHEWTDHEILDYIRNYGDFQSNAINATIRAAERQARTRSPPRGPSPADPRASAETGEQPREAMRTSAPNVHPSRSAQHAPSVRTQTFPSAPHQQSGSRRGAHVDPLDPPPEAHADPRGQPQRHRPHADPLDRPRRSRPELDPNTVRGQIRAEEGTSGTTGATRTRPGMTGRGIPATPRPRDDQRYDQAAPAPRRTGSARGISVLMRGYPTESKYGGVGDNFDGKLRIFHEMCGRCDVPVEARANAFPTMLTGLALDYDDATDALGSGQQSLDDVCAAMRENFEGPEYRHAVLQEWNTISREEVTAKAAAEDKPHSTSDGLLLLTSKLRHPQQGLELPFRGDAVLRNQLVTACQDHPSCQSAGYSSLPTVTSFLNDLRSSITTYERSHGDHPYQRLDDRQPSPDEHRTTRQTSSTCFVCGKPGCISNNHTDKAREESRHKFQKRRSNGRGDTRFDPTFRRKSRQDVLECGGDHDTEEEECESEDSGAETADHRRGEQTPEKQSTTSHRTSAEPISTEHARETSLRRCGRACEHSRTGRGRAREHGTAASADPGREPFTSMASSPERYTSKSFYGIMIDTGAAQDSTAGYNQYVAYSQLCHTLLEESCSGPVAVHTGMGAADSVGVIHVQTSLGTIEFHVVEVDTPFRLSLADMDRLGVYYNNVSNRLVAPTASVPVVRRFGHAFWLWNTNI